MTLETTPQQPRPPPPFKASGETLNREVLLDTPPGGAQNPATKVAPF
jgi:hypothetical protein